MRERVGVSVCARLRGRVCDFVRLHVYLTIG